MHTFPKLNWQLKVGNRTLIQSKSEPLLLPRPTPSTYLPLFWDCNWAASGSLPGLHSAVGNGVYVMCMCGGGMSGELMWEAEFTSRAGEQKRLCGHLHYSWPHNSLLLIYLFISCLRSERIHMTHTPDQQEANTTWWIYSDITDMVSKRTCKMGVTSWTFQTEREESSTGYHHIQLLMDRDWSLKTERMWRFAPEVLPAKCVIENM